MILLSCNTGFEDIDKDKSEGFTNFPDISVTEEEVNDKDLLTGREVYELSKELSQNDISEFRWKETDNHHLWSAIVAGDSTVIIGYKPSAEREIHTNSDAKNYLLAYMKFELERLGMVMEKEDIVLKEHNKLNAFTVQIPHIELLAKLRKFDMVRYIEPYGYSLDTYVRSESIPGGRVEELGCSLDEPVSSGALYTPFSGSYPNSWVSWHLSAHNIDDAWNISQGDNIWIGVTDTGISDNQVLLGQNFEYGPSNGRTIIKTGNGGITCDHGTSITGIIAGPVNNLSNITGVAYKANIESIKIADDVYLEPTHQKEELADAFVDLASTSRVVNCSMGFPSYSNLVKDAVNYLEQNDVLLVAAAGSASDIFGIYPAKYGNHNVLGASGVKYKPNSDPNGINLDDFSPNYKGQYVDYAVYLKHVETGGLDRFAYGMAFDHNNYVIPAKASSAAAATMTGIAALIMSKDPTLTGAQVRNILMSSSSYYRFNNKTRDNNFGWGIVDAEHALINMNFFVNINGPTLIKFSGNQTWYADVYNSYGTESYEWYWNGSLVSTADNYTRYVSSSSSENELKLEVTTTTGQYAEAFKYPAGRDL